MHAGRIRGRREGMSGVDREETESRDRSPSGDGARAERELLQQLRAGDVEAGRCFVRDFYPGVYRYLLLLSGRPKLAEDEREVMILRYLHDHSSAEISRIIGVPAGTVRYRLARGREKLQRELGEGDLPYLNEPSVPMREWAWLPLDQMHALETRLSWGGVRRWASGVGTDCRTPNAQRLTSHAESEAIEEESM